MQAVPGHKAKLIFDTDGLIVPAGVPEPLDGYTILAEGLYHWQAVDILDGRAGQGLLSPVTHRGGTGALPADAPQSKGGYQYADECYQGRGWAENGHTQQDHRHLDIAVDHCVNHLHALKFQCAQFRGESRQDVPQIVFGKVAQGHPLQDISQLHALLRRPFRSDTLLEPVFPVGEEEPQQDQHHNAA